MYACTNYVGIIKTYTLKTKAYVLIILDLYCCGVARFNREFHTPFSPFLIIVYVISL